MTHLWMPHGACVLWNPALLTLQILGNFIIALCYFLIPLAILSAMKPVNDKWSRLFAAFILLCGCTHVMQIVTVWHPLYWIEAGVTFSTAIVSAMTVINLYLHGSDLLKRPGSAGKTDDAG